MGRPLLTDDIIEKARRMETFESDDAVDFDTKVMTLPEKDEKARIYKSRRIENAKRSQLQSKLNVILIAVNCHLGICYLLSLKKRKEMI